jgi:hypothetical protein
MVAPTMTNVQAMGGADLQRASRMHSQAVKAYAAPSPPGVVFCLLNSETQEGNYRIGVTRAARRWHAGVLATVPLTPSPP